MYNKYKLIATVLVVFSFFFLGMPASVDAAISLSDYSWTLTPGGTGGDRAYGGAVDSSGNVYHCGYFNGTVDFDTTAGVDSHVSNGNADIYISKVSADSTYQWTITMGSSSLDKCEDMHIGSDDSLYIAGTITGTTDFDPSAGVTSITPSASVSAYIAKYDSSGNFVWVRGLEGSGSVTPWEIDLDSSDNIYATGNFANTVDFDASAGVDNHVATSNSDIFITKYDSSGNYLWTRTFGNTSISERAEHIAVTSDNGVVVSGRFYTFPTDFDGTAGVDEHTSNGDWDTFLTKYNSDGSYGWTRTYGSTSAEYGDALAATSDGYIYTTGRIIGNADLDGTAGVDNHTGDAGYITKYQNDGTFVWAKSFTSSFGVYPYAIDVDAQNNIIITGVANGYADFDPGPVNTNINMTKHKGFIARYYEDGTYGWVYTFGNTGNDVAGSYDFVYGADGSHYTFGSFNLTSEFDGTEGGSDIHSSAGSSDIYVIKYSDNYLNQISNLDSGLDATNVSGAGLEVGDAYGSISPTETVRVIDNGSNTYLADIETDMSVSDRDWSSVTGGSDPVTGNAYMHNFTTAPGTAASYTLYIPIPAGAKSDSVTICPNATSLVEAVPGCLGEVTYTESDPEASKVQLGGLTYWAVSGLTGTGGFSIIGSFDLKDTLSRLEVSTASDHTVEFGSVNDTNSSGDTITVQFDPVGQLWDLSSITIADIDLEDDGVDKTLAAAPGADIWGVNINTTTDTITFTAPTSGTDYIDASSLLQVKIGAVADGGSNQIVNPGTVNSYEVYITINNSATTETGEIEIPIIDDDTVNVTGYIDTFITFDIDTSNFSEQCDAFGGVSPCDSHSGVNDNVGYVIDLGEMSTSTVNDSGDSVLHADGVSGQINYIYFDLSSNANGGVSVTAQSLNGEFSGPGTEAIPYVADGSEVQITAGSGLFGINSYAFLLNSSLAGTAVKHVDCDGTSGIDYYCDVTTTPTEIFNTGGAPIDTLRMQWEVAASPDALDGTGTYTDELTFIATATF